MTTCGFSHAGHWLGLSFTLSFCCPFTVLRCSPAVVSLSSAVLSLSFANLSQCTTMHFSVTPRLVVTCRVAIVRGQAHGVVEHVRLAVLERDAYVSNSSQMRTQGHMRPRKTRGQNAFE